MYRSLLAMLLCTLLLATPAAAAPGDYSKFILFGTAYRADNPTNPKDQVIAITTSPENAVGGALRKVNQTVRSFDGKIKADYYMDPGKTCFGGSPRVSLLIDANNNGQWEGNDPVLGQPDKAIHGYLGPGPFGSLCQSGIWRHDNFTDADTTWDLTNYGAGYTNWPGVLLFFQTMTAANPTFSEQVIFAKLVEDSCSWAPPSAMACGTTYFDTIVLGERILENYSDATTGCPGEYKLIGVCP